MKKCKFFIIFCLMFILVLSGCSQSTNKSEMYPEYPTVPDFGTFANTSLKGKVPQSNGVMYIYDLNSKMADYLEILKSYNFEPNSTTPAFVTDDGDIVAMFSQNNINVFVSIREKDEEFIVIVDGGN